MQSPLVDSDAYIGMTDDFMPTLNSNSTDDSTGVSDASLLSFSCTGKKIFGGNKCVCKLDGTTLIIDTTRLSKVQVDNIYKVASNKDMSKSTKVDKPDRRAEIAAFLSQYSGGNYSDVPVATMRHIIPLFLMEVYSEIFGQFSFKVKGMWEKTPEDWPRSVPFVDPNNNLKTVGSKGSKPTKDVLMSMLCHLIQKHTKKGRKPARMAESRTYPQQVEDTEYVDLGSGHWDHAGNPVKEFTDRIQMKLDYLRKCKPSTEREVVKLSSSLASLSHYTSECFLIRAHALELFVDMLIEQGTLEQNWQSKLSILQANNERIITQTTSMSNVVDSRAQAKSSSGYSTTAGANIEFDLQSSGGASVCSNTQHEKDIFPHLNIETRGNVDNLLLTNLDLRPESVKSSEAADKGHCGSGVQECTSMKCSAEDTAASEYDFSLYEIMDNPEYDSGPLLQVLDDQIASGDTGELNSPKSGITDDVADGQNMALNDGPIDFNMFDGYNPNFCDSDFLDMHLPPPTNAVSNSHSNIFTKPPPTQAAPPFSLQQPIYDGRGISEIRSSEQVLTAMPVSPPSVCNQPVFYLGGMPFTLQVSSSAEPSPLTGSFQQMTLHNNVSPTPIARPTNPRLQTTEVRDSGEISFNMSSSRCVSSADDRPPPKSDNSNICKRAAPIPVMVEAFDSLDETPYNGPSQKKSRSSSRQ